MKLRALLEDSRKEVAKQANVVLSALTVEHKAEDLLDQDIDSLVALMFHARAAVPDKGSGLSKVDAVLVPLLELHRVLYMAQPAEEQLEPSELDLLSFGVERRDLDNAASQLGRKHLGEPSGPELADCLIYGPKSRILAVRTLRILRKQLSVTFIVDTGAPVTYISHDTLRAFGVDPAAQSSKFVRCTFEGGVTVDVYLFDPVGPHHDINVLGMDYLMAVNCTMEISGRSRSAKLIVK